MANFKDTTNIPIAIADNTKLDLSCKHITTANWMQLNPIYWKEMVPGEKLEVNVESFTRLNPLVVPTFAPGSKLKISRFFVPFRTIFRGWNDFITDTYHTPSAGQDGKDSGLIYKVPTFTNDTLLAAMVTPFTNYSTPYGNVFAESAATVSASTELEQSGCDFITNGGVGYVYTPIGRQALKVLQSLGYKINPNYGDTQEYSALPLLAFCKVYSDYYFPSAYMNSYIHYYMESIFNNDASSTAPQLNATQIALLLRFCIYVCYDSDYFVSAFDNPVAPSNGNYTNMQMIDYSLPNPFYTNNVVGGGTGTPYNYLGTVANFNTSTGLTAATSTNGTPAIQGLSAGAAVLTQYADSMLHRLTDYMKRHQLAGSRAMERYLSRFGKSLSAEKLNRSIYLGTDTTTIEIGDVMSTSDTLQAQASGAKANTGSSDTTGTTYTGAQLGAYAGKGIAYSKNDYDGFETDEYGIYIITASLVPDVFYDQGLDANNLHIYKSEFWTPEFDYGMRSLTADELIMVNDGRSPYASGSVHNQVFGFTPRYSEYRFGRSRLTGSFRIPTLNGNSEFGSDAWHMMRKFDDRSFPGTGGTLSLTSCVHSPSFVYGVRDAGQYNRIFFNDDYNAPDQFVQIYSFDVKSYSPMASLYENYDWCDDQSGRMITTPTNGVKVN